MAASCLVDTGFLFALADRGDAWHERCRSFANDFRGKFITPVTVLPEACYLINRYLGVDAELSFLAAMEDGESELATLATTDLGRARQILRKYRDLNIGFVDASLVAIAERLKISSIATTDRRHFSVIKPKHCNALLLLP